MSTVQCPSCGARVSQQDAFCPVCGSPLPGGASPQQPVQPAGAEQGAAVPGQPAAVPQQPQHVTALPPQQTAPQQGVPGQGAPAQDTPTQGTPVAPQGAAAPVASQPQGAAPVPPQQGQQSGAGPVPPQYPQQGYAPGAYPVPPQQGQGGSVPPQVPPQNFQYGGPGAPGGPIQAYGMPPASPLKRAWNDFKASPDKFKIILKLAGLQFVPGVGSLALNGYAYSWGADEALGRHFPMPTKVIRPGVLDTGLYTYGVSLVMAAALFLLTMLLTLVFGALGLGMLLMLVLLAFTIFFAPFSCVMFMRTALAGRMRSGLNVKRAWDLFSAPGKTSKAFTSCWGPAAVVGVVAFILTFAFIVLFAGVMLQVSSTAAYASAYMYSSFAVFRAAMNSLLGLLLLVCIFAFVLFFLSTAASIVVARAFGYWIQDFHPEQWDECRANAQLYADRTL